MATHADTPVPAPPSPDLSGDYFRVMDWHVFTPGYHKNDLYTVADCKQIVANFQQYSTGENAYVKPVGKVGHEDKQSIKLSLGLPAAGRITACRSTPEGGFAIDVEKIHRVGINEQGETFDFYDRMLNGGYPTGSVEIERVPDPDDPAKTIPGYVLTGVSFLGEEAPGVTGLPSPKAIFNRYSKKVFAMRDQYLQQLKDLGVPVEGPDFAGKSDDELQSLLAVLTSQSFDAAMQAKYGSPATPDPVNTPDPAPVQMAASDGDGAPDEPDSKTLVSMSSMVKRMAACEQKLGSMGKPEDIKQMAAFSRSYEAERATRHRNDVTNVVEQACREGRLQPIDKPDQIELGLARSNTQKFGAGVDAGKTAYDVWRNKLLARPVNASFSQGMEYGSGNTIGDEELNRYAAHAMTKTGPGRAELARQKAESKTK